MFDDFVRDMDATVMECFGVEAIWNGKRVVHIVIDRDVVRVNEFGEAARNALEISVQRSQANPTLKDQFKTTQGIFVVDQILSDDGHVIRCAVNKL